MLDPRHEIGHGIYDNSTDVSQTWILLEGSLSIVTSLTFPFLALCFHSCANFILSPPRTVTPCMDGERGWKNGDEDE